MLVGKIFGKFRVLRESLCRDEVGGEELYGRGWFYILLVIGFSKL